MSSSAQWAADARAKSNRISAEQLARQTYEQSIADAQSTFQNTLTTANQTRSQTQTAAHHTLLTTASTATLTKATAQSTANQAAAENGISNQKPPEQQEPGEGSVNQFAKNGPAGATDRRGNDDQRMSPGELLYTVARFWAGGWIIDLFRGADDIGREFGESYGAMKNIDKTFEANRQTQRRRGSADYELQDHDFTKQRYGHDDNSVGSMKALSQIDLANKIVTTGTVKPSAGSLKGPSRFGPRRRVTRYGRPSPTTLTKSRIEFPAEVAEVPISSLERLHPVPRPGKPSTHISRMAKDMQGAGFKLRDSIQVFRMPDGSLRVAGGHHRIAAMELAGETTIPSQILDWSKVSPPGQAWFRKMFPHLDWP